MTVREIVNQTVLTVVNDGTHLDDTITCVACCDLLSVAMSSVDTGSAWITVTSNINTLAVATLVDATCVIFAYGIKVNDTLLEKASKEGITVLTSPLPSYETAREVDQILHA